MNKPIFGKNLFSAKFLKKSVLPYTRRQIRRKYNKITAQKNIWVESDFDFFRFVVCCIQVSICRIKLWGNLKTFFLFFYLFFFSELLVSSTVNGNNVTFMTIYHIETVMRRGRKLFYFRRASIFWHRENEHLSNKTGYCYLENTRILYGDANPLKNSSGRHMKWYDSRVRYMVSLSYGNVFHFFTEKPHSAVTQAKRENM